MESKTVINEIFYSILLFSVFSVIEKKELWFKIFIIISVVFIWMMFFIEKPLLKYLAFSFTVAVFSIASVKMVIQIIRQKEVNTKLILETINGYLLIGIIFTFLNLIISVYNPSAISFTEDNTMLEMGSLIYFSFISMTSIGYGEIVPISSIARSTSVMSAIIGQMYLAIIMAFIIGKFLTQKKNNEKF